MSTHSWQSESLFAVYLLLHSITGGCSVWTGQIIYFTSCLQYFIYFTLCLKQNIYFIFLEFFFCCFDPKLGLVLMWGLSNWNVILMMLSKAMQIFLWSIKYYFIYNMTLRWLITSCKFSLEIFFSKIQQPLSHWRLTGGPLSLKVWEYCSF